MKLNHKKIASCPCGCAVRKNKRGRWVVVGEVNDECECGCAQLPHHMSCQCGRCDDCIHEEDLDIEELEKEAAASEEVAQASEKDEWPCIRCKHPSHVGECWVDTPDGPMLCSCFSRFPFEGRNHIISDSPFLVNGEKLESLVYSPPKGVPVTIRAGSSPVYVGGYRFEIWRGKSRPYVLEPGRSARVVLVQEIKATSHGEWEVTPLNAQAQAQAQAKAQKAPHGKATVAAWHIATGESAPDPAAQPRRIWGAANQGITLSRRVWRAGAWQWVSEPAADRHDVKYGDVWPGEVIATYTLGGSRMPDAWHLATDQEAPLVRLAASWRRDGQWILTLQETDEHLGLPGEVVVPNPYWLP